MHSKRVTDGGKSQKRYHRSVGPNVTINNIVTLDPQKYTRGSSTSKLSQDTDYDRVKFLVEERARYWRDLKVLYNDYTLVKLKQKELLDAEDNYVNQHCIEETVKLSSALKLKIQAKCKDIIFITHLCGNSEVNRVVQNLADGEDIDSVLIKKQKSISEKRKAEEEQDDSDEDRAGSSETKVKVKKKKVHKTVKEVDKKEKPVPSVPNVPPKRKSSINEPKFFDSELHWCQYCNVFPPTIKKYLQHLHDESHKKKIKELKINESPWHKCLPEEQAWRTDSTESVRVKAFNFFVPANGWFCQLCRSWMGDIHCAATHLRSYVHNMNLKNFQEKFPNWKQGWLDERSKALEKTFEGRKESSLDNTQDQNSKGGKKKEESDSSGDEQDPEEPISRHRTSKAKMWVPNPKAFERVCNETNPNHVPSFSESTMSKMKLQKKDRPPFIGKMPLISSINKKIVMKELPQNTTEKIATSCAESDKLQREQDELKELIIQRNEAENEMKLKEFMRVAEKIKKGSRKRKRQLDSAIAAESYNAMDYAPVVEPVDPIDNLINPPTLVAQWEADANYEYHMRQLQHYNMTAQMMQMPQPQTFLLDPYHAIALHNQQYYNSSHNMISNQYENFEIISRDDEQVYSQYIDFQNSPSSSPAKKMFSSGKSEANSDTKSTSSGIRDKRRKDSTKQELHKTGATESPERQSSAQEEALGKEKRSKNKLHSQSLKPKKPKSSHIIQKPACLNIPSSNDLMPSFKETFLSNADIIPSSGYISSLLSSCADVKIVSANEVYKKKAPSKRRRIKKKLKSLQANETEASNVEPSEHISEEQESKLDLGKEINETCDRLKNTVNETTTGEDNVHSTSSTQTPKKSQSLQDKINSIKKAIDRTLLEKLEDIPAKKAMSDVDKDDSVPRSSGHTGYRSSRLADAYNVRSDEDDDSEDDGDAEKLIYYDMTSI